MSYVVSEIHYLANGHSLCVWRSAHSKATRHRYSS